MKGKYDFRFRNYHTSDIMFSILITLAVGTLAGWLAGRLMDKNNQGWLKCMLLGVGGAFVGNMLGKLLGIHTAFLKLSFGSVASAVIGACLLTWAVKKFLK